MLRKLIFLFFLIFSLDISPCFSKEKIYKLCIRIEPIKKTFKINESIILKITLVNCGEETLYLYPSIKAEFFNIYDGCFPTINFDIESSKGEKLNYQYKGNLCQMRIRMPTLENFFPLHSNYYYGAKIAINKDLFEYGPFEEGEYKIKAFFSSKARGCQMNIYEKELNLISSQIDKEKIFNIFEGEIYSNEIKIKIVK